MSKRRARPGRFIKIATPVFDGAQDSDIQLAFEAAGLDKTGQARVVERRAYRRDVSTIPVTVGIYVLR